MKKAILTCLPIIAAGTLSSFSTTTYAHGYISKPESRGFLCRKGENTSCGSVVYEPQSLEGVDRYPETGPADGQLASAGLRVFSPLDAQTVNRWTKRPIKSGANEFTWTFTAAHSTRDWRYFITKKDWNPNQPLTRAQFESVPFCSYSGNFRQPPRTLTHLCNVPADRSGYHIVMGVWDVGDTPMSFYNVIDVMIDNGNAGDVQWNDVGDIHASHDLAVGDKAIARVFSGSGEITSLAVELLIETAQQGDKNTWPKLLAEKINQSQSWMQAGLLDKDNQVQPISGKNEIYAQSGSGIERVEIGYKIAPPPAANVSITGIGHRYFVENDAVNFAFNFDTDMAAKVTVTLNQGTHTVAKLEKQVEVGHTAFELPYPNAKAGHYNLTVSHLAENGSQAQKGFHLNIFNQDTNPGEPGGGDNPGGNPGSAEYTFPDSLTSYKAGTVVFQPKNGKNYQCKPWPNNGYCVQYSAGSNQFEPGVGLYWTMAWEEVHAH